MSRLKTLARYWLAATVLFVAVFMLAALLGAVIPRNRDFRPQPDGVRIWTLCSDIHTDIVVPARNEDYDWTASLPDGDPSDKWIAMGWGDRRFYLETPTWADIKVATVLGATCGIHPTAMHVEWIRGDLGEGPQCRPLWISHHGYQSLCLFISASFTRGADHKIEHIAAPGYGASDAFYEAEGRYSMVQTCNNWAGQTLAAGGVRVGIWTPFKWGVLWQL